MSQELDNSPEDFLRNIAEGLTALSGDCTEIKQAQLTAATTDDINNMGTSIASAVIEKVDTIKSAIDSQSQAVSEIGDNLTDSVKSLTTVVTEKIDSFTANPPVQKVEKTIRIAKNTSSNTSATSSSSLSDSASNTASNTSPSPSRKSTMTPPTMSKPPT